ncbi:MAG: hypothetical protein V3573_14225 [Desulfovibrionaceae bacterium]
MSKAWIMAKRPEFVRDMFRNFCQACGSLDQEFERYDRMGCVDFEQLKELIGEESFKGLLWRLKDTAHHVFRNDPDDPIEGRFMDWGLGYIFHECIKLKEDSYQQLTYAPWLKEMAVEGANGRHMAGQLLDLPSQTEESMRREIARIRVILDQCKRLLPVYLSRHSDNALLARLIFAQNDMVRRVFGDLYSDLVSGIYGEQPWMLYVLASRSLRLGGWMDQARTAVAEAHKIHPDGKIVLQEKKIIDNWSLRIDS